MTSDLSQSFEHDQNMQAFEQEGAILIAIVDQTYGISDDTEWERDRERFRLSLEHEFGLRFEDGNIGPGADLPAFLTLLQAKKRVPLWCIAAAIFFSGKPLEENFQAWRDMAIELQHFLQRPAYLNRQGASVLAVQAVVDQLGHDPKRLQLLSYRVIHVGELENLVDFQPETEIADAPPTLNLGFIAHVFEIEADNAVFRVSVDGRSTKIVRLN